MKAVWLGAVIGVGIGASVLWSCTTNRASDNFKCTTQADCATDRTCVDGYCIIGGGGPIDAPRAIDAEMCPAICKGTCNYATNECTITGTGSGNITCPTGWNCIINCATPGACGSINCQQGLSCDVNCTTDMACLSVTCNTKPCDVTCTGVNACGNIGCTSGNCTAACTGSGACGTITCGSGDCKATCAGGSAACGNITCSSGNCNANCTGSGACGNITCATGDCTTSCTGGSAACGTLNCGTGACTAACGAGSACGAISCVNACKCDVACDPTMLQCPVMTCPDPNGPAFCMDTMGRCDSTLFGQCNQCN